MDKGDNKSMIRTIIVGVLTVAISLFATPAFAEEIVEETTTQESSNDSGGTEESSPEPAPETEPTPEPEPEPAPEPEPEPAPEPEPSYTPPPEADDGVGGWAVVNPETGKVHGVIVATKETYEARGGKIGTSYMGCHADCVLRFQTKSTADGNVAGYSSGGGTDVSFDKSNDTFKVTTRDGDESRTRTLVPSKTATDKAGMDLSTGFVDRFSAKRNNNVSVEVYEDDENSLNDSASVEYLTWGSDKKLFNYANLLEAAQNLNNDVEEELSIDFTTVQERVIEEEVVDPDTGETTITQTTIEETVVDEENSFVKTIRTVTSAVNDFFARLLGGQ